MKAGVWPKSPYTDSSYTDLGAGIKHRRFRAPYIERIIDVTATVELYCDEAGRDGGILRTRFSENYYWNSNCDGLAQQLGMTTQEVRDIVKRALKFVSEKAQGK